MFPLEWWRDIEGQGVGKLKLMSALSYAHYTAQVASKEVGPTKARLVIPKVPILWLKGNFMIKLEIWNI